MVRSVKLARIRRAIEGPQTHKQSVISDIKSLKANVRALNAGDEKKQFGTQSTTSTFNSSYLPLNLNAMPAGDGISGREGQEIYMRGLSVRFHARANTGGLAVNSNCRLIIYMDKQANEANPANLADILQDASAGEDYFTSHYQHDYSKRYKILCDRQFTLNSENPTWHMNKYAKLNKKATYADGNSGIGSVTTNAVSMLLLSDIASGSTAPLAYYATRLFFTG